MSDRSAVNLSGADDLLLGLKPAAEDFAITICDRLLEAAERADASDLHLRPQSEGLQPLLRTGGDLATLGRPLPAGDRIVARMKVLAGLLTYRTDIPQEGRIARDDDRSIRLATGPTVQGEKAVLRWTASSLRLQIDELGLSPETASAWKQMLAAPQGLLLVTGPAGSGKTTTAYASLRHLQDTGDRERSLVTLEDPVEAILDGVAQTQVQPSEEFGFAAGLRAALRHDPEVLLVGEIRDADTLSTAVRGSLTGHLILSTLHTGSAAEAITRLLDMQIEPYLVASSVRGVMQQRLLRTVEGERVLLAELLDLRDDRLADLIRSRPTTRQLAAAIETTGVREQGEALLASGRITQAEFYRAFSL